MQLTLDASKWKKKMKPIQINGSHTQRIEENLKYVQHVYLRHYSFKGDFYAEFLKYCENLEHLEIRGNFEEIGFEEAKKYQWLLQKYPNIERMTWGINPTMNLIPFLKQHLNIYFSFRYAYLDEMVNVLKDGDFTIHRIILDTFRELYPDHSRSFSLKRISDQLNTLKQKKLSNILA